jgi:hypothetical protein
MSHVPRTFLVVGTGLLGLTAVPGRAMALLGLYSPPVVMLHVTRNSTFSLPGPALAVVVVGPASLAVVLLIRRHRLGCFSAVVAGLAVMTFEFLPVVSTGAMAGPSRVMHVLQFAVGPARATAALAAQFIPIRPPAILACGERHPNRRFGLSPFQVRFRGCPHATVARRGADRQM